MNTNKENNGAFSHIPTFFNYLTVIQYKVKIYTKI